MRLGTPPPSVCGYVIRVDAILTAVRERDAMVIAAHDRPPSAQRTIAVVEVEGSTVTVLGEEFGRLLKVQLNAGSTHMGR